MYTPEEIEALCNTITTYARSRPQTDVPVVSDFPATTLQNGRVRAKSGKTEDQCVIDEMKWRITKVLFGEGR